MTLSEDIIFLSTYFNVTYDVTDSGHYKGETLKSVENVAVPVRTGAHIMDFATLCKGKLFVDALFEDNIRGMLIIKKGEETVASGNINNRFAVVPVRVEKGDIFSIHISNTTTNTVATNVTVNGNYVPNGYAIGLVR